MLHKAMIIVSVEAARHISSASLQSPYNPLSKVCSTCRIPVPYLVNTKKFLAPELPEAPLIVFINSKSGGHAGPELTEVLYHTLGHAQVSSLLPLPIVPQRAMPTRQNFLPTCMQRFCQTFTVSQASV